MSRFWIKTYTNYVIVCCGQNFHSEKCPDKEIGRGLGNTGVQATLSKLVR